MALTMDELKSKYHKIVVEKGNAAYFSWVKTGISSKRLVAKANEYAFHPRLKADGAFRLEVLAFAYALGLRIEKRYSTFWRKLFRLFAFLRERAALKTLKRVLGFDDDTDMREMIDVEFEKLSVILSKRSDRNTRGGGLRIGLEEPTAEEQMESFLEECLSEEMEKGKAKPSKTDKAEGIEKTGAPSSKKEEKADREKISVDEKKNAEKGTKEKTEEGKKEQTEQKETDFSEGKDTEKVTVKTTEKSVASTSIIAEVMVAAERMEKAPPSPFPIFREENGGTTSTAEQEISTTQQEGNEPKNHQEPMDTMEQTPRTENGMKPPPSPVFREENGVKPVDRPIPQAKEKPIGKPIEKPIEKPIDNGLGKPLDLRIHREIRVKEEVPIYETMNISEENRTRIKLNITMNKMQIQAITNQLKEAAEMAMAQEEQAWREQISVAEGKNLPKSQPIGEINPQNNGNVIKSLKK